MTSTIVKYLIVILVAFHLSSCSYKSRYTAANEKVDKFFSWLERGSVDSVFTLFAKNTYNESDSSKFRDALLQLNKKGKIVSKRNYSVKQRTEHTGGNKVIYTQVRYRVHYANDNVMFFSFVFGKDKNNDDELISVVFNNNELD